jgi:5-formyltetrahydrofolate cyclo-ligase
MHSEVSTRRFRQAAWGRSGKLFVLRFTRRELRHPRLETTISCNLSPRSASGKALRAGERRTGAACDELSAPRLAVAS